jgi:hypothetical protein
MYERVVFTVNVPLVMLYVPLQFTDAITPVMVFEYWSTTLNVTVYVVVVAVKDICSVVMKLVSLRATCYEVKLVAETFNNPV